MLPTAKTKREAAALYAPLFLLILLALVTMTVFNRPLIRGDGTAYLAWVDTLILDGDVDFGNQLDKLRPVNTYQIAWSDELQRLVNVFPFGVAFVQAPFYLAGHLFATQGWWNLNPDYFAQNQGVPLSYSAWLMIGANVMALISMILAWLIGRRLCNSWLAAGIAWAIFLGSPLFYYSTISPLNSHNPGAFTTTCFIYLLLLCSEAFRREGDKQPRTYHWLLLGFWAGMMVLVRWQLLLVTLPAWGLLAWQRQWRGLGYAGVMMVVTLLPLPLIWQQMFGQPFLVPFDTTSDQSFLGAPAQIWLVFRETFHQSPILLLSLLGIPFLWRLKREWTIVAVSMIVLQVIINGAALDWWGGDSYGLRRMAELYPVYVLLACAAFAYMPVPRRFRSLWLAATRGLLVGLILFSLLYILAFIDFTWTNPNFAFIDSPETMIRYFLEQPNRWQILRAVMQAHVGPSSWPMPGP